VHSEAHQPCDYIVGLVLRSVMDYNGIDSRPVHRHPAHHVLHQAKTFNQLKPMTTEKLQEAQYHYDFIQEAQKTLEHISVMKQKRKVVISGLNDSPNNTSLIPKPIEITNEELVDLIFRKVIEDIEANLAFCEAKFNEL